MFDGLGTRGERLRPTEFKSSVVVPCHNAGRWIAEALRSVATQTLPAHEIIVVDDGSSDDSVLQIRNCGVAVELVQVELRNAAAARNVGIEMATGDWIALLDADDVWYPHHLARAAELLASSDDVAFMSNHDWISLEGDVVPIPEPFQCKLPTPRSALSFDDFFRLGKQGFHFGHSTVIYRREQVIAAGMFDVTQERRHDLDLWLRVIARGGWTYDTLNGAGYREATPNSISKNEMECDYYNLRALVKNVALVDSLPLRQQLSREARRSMGIAFVAAGPEDYARIKELAWPHLPPFYAGAYSLGSLCPSLVRSLITAKRRLLRRRANAVRLRSQERAS